MNVGKFKSFSYISLAFGGLALIAALIAFCVQKGTPDYSFDAQSANAPTASPCNCWCAALPLVVNNHPVQPTPQYERNTLALLPQWSEIGQGEELIIDVRTRARFEVVELRLFYSPTVLIAGAITSTLPCQIVSVKQQPGVIAYDCELAQEMDIDGNILTMAFTGGMTGTTNIEPYANGAFVGNDRGYGWWLVNQGATITVR